MDFEKIAIVSPTGGASRKRMLFGRAKRVKRKLPLEHDPLNMIANYLNHHLLSDSYLERSMVMENFTEEYKLSSEWKTFDDVQYDVEQFLKSHSCLNSQCLWDLVNFAKDEFEKQRRKSEKKKISEVRKRKRRPFESIYAIHSPGKDSLQLGHQGFSMDYQYTQPSSFSFPSSAVGRYHIDYTMDGISASIIESTSFETQRTGDSNQSNPSCQIQEEVMEANRENYTNYSNYSRSDVDYSITNQEMDTPSLSTQVSYVSQVNQDSQELNFSTNDPMMCKEFNTRSQFKSLQPSYTQQFSSIDSFDDNQENRQSISFHNDDASTPIINRKRKREETPSQIKDQRFDGPEKRRKLTILPMR